jgi:predicted nucleotidyltransferase
MFDSAFEAVRQEQNLSMHSSTIPLSDTFLEDLVTEVDNEHIRGIVLGGSQARGDATPYSDVDLACSFQSPYVIVKRKHTS